MGVYSRGRKPFNAKAVTGTNTYYSDVWIKNDAKDVIAIVKFTGTMTGTFTVEICCASEEEWQLAIGKDNGVAGGSAVNALIWDTYDRFDPAIPAISGAATFTLKMTRLGAPMVRFKYVNATNSGTVTVQIAGN